MPKTDQNNGISPERKKEENMISLSRFRFPGEDDEWGFYCGNETPLYSSYYPFGVLRKYNGLELNFAPLTIIYGGNGSGKTTILNVIAEKTGAQRTASYNRSVFYENYLELCEYKVESTLPEERRIITSDEIFDYMLDLRAMNEGINNKRDELVKKYIKAKFIGGNVNFLGEDDPISLNYSVRGLNKSEFVNKYLGNNIREHSNGETAIKYFYDNLQENGLYLLDEPENSLSPKRQLELAEVIYEHVNHLGCQMIISTHSPFMLAIKGAMIYDLDNNVKVSKWTELAGVRAYYDFFMEHEWEFS